MKKPMGSPEASPYKSVAEELEHLRKIFHAVSHRYSVRIEIEITELKDRVLAMATKSEAATGASDGGIERTLVEVGKRTGRAGDTPARQTNRFHDLRDMLTLLRTFEVTSGVARRKDLKRIESVLEELKLLARHWT